MPRLRWPLRRPRRPAPRRRPRRPAPRRPRTRAGSTRRWQHRQHLRRSARSARRPHRRSFCYPGFRTTRPLFAPPMRIAPSRHPRRRRRPKASHRHPPGHRHPPHGRSCERPHGRSWRSLLRRRPCHVLPRLARRRTRGASSPPAASRGACAARGYPRAPRTRLGFPPGGCRHLRPASRSCWGQRA